MSGTRTIRDWNPREIRAEAGRVRAIAEELDELAARLENLKPSVITAKQEKTYGTALAGVIKFVGVLSGAVLSAELRGVSGVALESTPLPDTFAVRETESDLKKQTGRGKKEGDESKGKTK